GQAFQQWMKHVTALPAADRIEAVSEKLVELNPGFDGKLMNFNGSGPPRIENEVVTELGIRIDNVTDISPVRAFTELTDLNSFASRAGDSIFSDLSPIKGMNLFTLQIQSRSVRDLSPLEGMPLTTLNCQYCPINDLSPLRKMPLRRLYLSDTKV